MEAILTELEVCFGECNLQIGEYPFEEGEGWREAGIPSCMVIRFCERQTEKGNPTSCNIFHNTRKIYAYQPPEAVNHVVFAAQESHCYFYTAATHSAIMSTVDMPARSSNYGCYRVREPFAPERGRPFKEWEPYWKLRALASTGFQELRRPKRVWGADV